MILLSFSKLQELVKLLKMLLEITILLFRMVMKRRGQCGRIGEKREKRNEISLFPAI